MKNKMDVTLLTTTLVRNVDFACWLHVSLFQVRTNKLCHIFLSEYDCLAFFVWVVDRLLKVSLNVQSVVEPGNSFDRFVLSYSMTHLFINY